MNHFFHTCAILLVLFCCSYANSQNNQLYEPVVITWSLADINNKAPEGFSICGKPETVRTNFGEALHFNGRNDCIIADNNPVEGLKSFTIELLFRPDRNGKKEQRFLHFGEIDGDRVLLETRSNKKGWWLDSYVKSGEKQVILIDPDLIHGYDKWYHVAMVCDNGKVMSFVDGKKELEGFIDLEPVKGKNTSIGVRQNLLYWFKGSISIIKITPESISPDKFITF